MAKFISEMDDTRAAIRYLYLVKEGSWEGYDERKWEQNLRALCAAGSLMKADGVGWQGTEWRGQGIKG